MSHQFSKSISIQIFNILVIIFMFYFVYHTDGVVSCFSDSRKYPNNINYCVYSNHSKYLIQ